MEPRRFHVSSYHRKRITQLIMKNTQRDSYSTVLSSTVRFCLHFTKLVGPACAPLLKSPESWPSRAIIDMPAPPRMLRRITKPSERQRQQHTLSLRLPLFSCSLNDGTALGIAGEMASDIQGPPNIAPGTDRYHSPRIKYGIPLPSWSFRFFEQHRSGRPAPTFVLFCRQTSIRLGLFVL